jgi:hypothetical protein
MEEIARDYAHNRNFALASTQMDDLFKSYEPAKLAYHFFVMLRSPPTSQHFLVVTSNLALLEARSVIAEEYVERQLFSKRIARRFWKSARAKIRLSNEDLDCVKSPSGKVEISPCKFPSGTTCTIGVWR